MRPQYDKQFRKRKTCELPKLSNFFISSQWPPEYQQAATIIINQSKYHAAISDSKPNPLLFRNELEKVFLNLFLYYSASCNDLYYSEEVAAWSCYLIICLSILLLSTCVCVLAGAPALLPARVSLSAATASLCGDCTRDGVRALRAYPGNKLI